MSISTELTNYSTYLTNAYNKCNDKGATMPQNKNLQNLTSCINSISSVGNYFSNEYPNRTYALASALTELPNITFPQSNTSTQYMFNGFTSLTTINISNFDTRNVLNMSSMFANCSSLTNIVFPQVYYCDATTNMSSMFSYCINLASLDLSCFANTTRVTSMASMLQGLSKATTINLSSFVPSACTSLNNMASTCALLTTINLGNNFLCSAVTNIASVLSSCPKLENIIGSFKNIGQGYTRATANYSSYTINLSGSTLLTHDSLMNIINGLYDLATARKSKSKLNDWSNKSCKAFKHRNRSCNK